MAAIKVYNKDTNNWDYFVLNGKSAYEAAIEGGFTGSESEFNTALGSLDNLDYLPLSGGTMTGSIKFQDGNYTAGIYFDGGSLELVSENASDGVVSLRASSYTELIAPLIYLNSHHIAFEPIDSGDLITFSIPTPNVGLVLDITSGQIRGNSEIGIINISGSDAGIPWHYDGYEIANKNDLISFVTSENFSNLQTRVTALETEVGTLNEQLEAALKGSN